MPVVSADLHDRFDFEVDPDAEPADWDRVVAKFLLALVRKKATVSVDSAAAVAVDRQFSADTERHVE